MKKFLIIMYCPVMIAMTTWGDSARATLLDGKTIEWQFYFPDLSSPVSYPYNGIYVVGLEIEISDPVNSWDFSDANILINWQSSTFNPLAPYINAAFNGVRITDINNSIDPFASVTINAVSNLVGFDNSRISLDANNIWINLQGLSFPLSPALVSLDINVASNSTHNNVPEPSTVLLFSASALGLVRRFLNLPRSTALNIAAWPAE